jgi:hypothetical protein
VYSVSHLSSLLDLIEIRRKASSANFVIIVSAYCLGHLELGRNSRPRIYMKSKSSIDIRPKKRKQCLLRLEIDSINSALNLCLCATDQDAFRADVDDTARALEHCFEMGFLTGDH